MSHTYLQIKATPRICYYIGVQMKFIYNITSAAAAVYLSLIQGSTCFTSECATLLKVINEY